ncbi:hypothetical protein TPHA_0E00180 [Tetrapisispora phaffii CBS 4417]|uniref:Uncharacterized protein n=1 Tax=Tetrapisispora phaffii (strain ATCC 24235 / CBS 4417 / NBRC 1672 / NRRL Y-8282 / UCD 70-5) TaxID=1071381 RepID=G8BT87_TETPH|nr:hypothetical protein TPHA_0E00180 [Tetrapisispora phaffii CBS 4417]CCE63115.1 hypothetical protein TPHA_0E00180 [Tetrapisispora phaffii CBS 4417]
MKSRLIIDHKRLVSHLDSRKKNKKAISELLATKKKYNKTYSKLKLNNNFHNFKCSSASVSDLRLSINKFNMLLKASSNKYDEIHDINSIEKLSQNEFIVTTIDSKTLILHSNEKNVVNSNNYTLKYQQVAINSKYYLSLYNDLNWYLDWKFYDKIKTLLKAYIHT